MRLFCPPHGLFHEHAFAPWLREEQAQLTNFIQVLETYAERRKSVDIGHLMVALTMDYILASMFGFSFGIDYKTLEVLIFARRCCVKPRAIEAPLPRIHAKIL